MDEKEVKTVECRMYKQFFILHFICKATCIMADKRQFSAQINTLYRERTICFNKGQLRVQYMDILKQFKFTQDE